MSGDYLGDFAQDATIYFQWSTNNSSGASITRATDGEVRVYKNNGTTQSTEGVTDTEDFDSLTGVHACTIVTTNVFYAGGADYDVVLQGAVIDGETVNHVLKHFSIENRSGLRPTTSGRTLDVTAGGAAGIDWGNVENKTTANDLSATDIQLCDTTTDVTNDVGITAAAVDAIWDEVLTGATHNVATSSGRRLRELADATIIRDADFQAGSTTSALILDASASATDDFYNHTLIRIIDGAAGGQERVIADYDGTTKTATITPALVTAAPSSGDAFEIVSGGAVHAATTNGGYLGGAVWVDTVNGTAGTLDYVNGTSNRPVDNLTDAYTIAASQNLTRFQIEPGSSVTLPSDSSGFIFQGSMYDVALNSQAISNTTFRGADSITGIATGASPPTFFSCGIGTCTLPPFTASNCGFFGTVTFGTAGSFTLGNCAEVFSLAPVFDYGAALNASTLHLRAWQGGSIEIQNAGAGTGTYELEAEGGGQIIINANCSATTNVTLDGTWRLTNNASGITLDEEANINATNINTEVDAALDTAIPGSPTADSINERIQSMDVLTEASGDGDLAAILVDTGTTLPATLAALNDIAAADVWDLSNGIETGWTPRQAMRIIAAACGGKLSGAATTTNTIRDIADAKDRITATVDADGNRTAVTLDGT